jgi:hypothetical protein
MSSSSLRDVHNVSNLLAESMNGPVVDERLSIPCSPPSLKVNFLWAKQHITVSNTMDPAKPVYVVAYHLTSSPTLVFRRCSDNVLIGTGINKAVSISPEYTIGDQRGTIQAEARMFTQYTHESLVYYIPSGGPPSRQVLHWRTDCNRTTWDFICYDESDTHMAKFQTNVWSFKEVGIIDFYEPCRDNPTLMEEILVVALTMYYQMVIRMSNPLSLLGMIPDPQPHTTSDRGKDD